MEARQLRVHKDASKVLARPPVFKPVKRGKLPRPFHRMGGTRLTSTGMVKLALDYWTIFFVRDGSALSDTAFLGYLMYELPSQELTPLFELHWHPGHKGFHCKTPCRDSRDFAGRQLPGVRELSMKTLPLDPRVEAHRQELIAVFCGACGIGLGWLDSKQRRLQL